ncbi:hypothetical protein C7I87_00750 [Mesorhizobium sp. SARCC-RB16n]|uniref:hypothetical protein n=1 Tax=Mesorhizobium sp. SARCC-RB16n TaxID=2116687 RepID=UPI00122EE592|nr:hypothetical protein [Mesorhizobium sp. SARCC-RB16n]KAA3452741.1 hypothetical protein C7I87_00750 [Mesorhizobium sp. SARCC-RB16n]
MTTIHTAFWNDRRAAVRHASIQWTVRDGNRQRCYNSEAARLHPRAGKFDDRQAAKGFARLCAKIAIRHMIATGVIADYDKVTQEVVRASFKVAMTKESRAVCDGCSAGVYFAKWGWTDTIITHEVAHWADQWAHKLGGKATLSAYEPHGPKWRGWYTYLLAAASDRFTVEGITAGWKADRLPVLMP